LDLFLFATMLIVCGGIGLPLARLLPERFEWRILTAPTFGLCVLAVLSPATYQWGLSVTAFFYGAVVVALASIGWHARELVAAAGSVDRRAAAWLLGGWLACTLVLLLPRWIGGDQFSVFQGNAWDTFGYLESAVVFAGKPFAVIDRAPDALVAQYPFFELAKGQLEQRPSVHLLYAVFSRAAPGDAYRLYYPYLVGFFSQFFLVAVFALRSILPRARLPAALAVAAVFPLGFWGQWVLDINSWSQQATVPTLFLMAVLLMHAAAGEASLRLTAALAVLVAGSAFLYPEGFIIVAAATFPVAFALPAWRMLRARRLELRAFVPLGSIAGLATTALYTPVYHWAIRQVTWSGGSKVGWWQFFFMFLQGRDARWNGGAAQFAQKTDFAAGLCGLYFATPVRGTGKWLATLQRWAIALVIVALLAALVATFVKKLVDDGARRAVLAWTAMVALVFAPALWLARAANYWPAGKIVSYAAPLFMTLLCLPVLYAPACKWLRALRWIVVAFAAFQLAGGLMRIAAAARDPDGIVYAWPYPATSPGPGVKQLLGWDFTGLAPYVSPDTKVLIHPVDVWLDPPDLMWTEHELIVFLFSHDVPYARPGPVNTYFGVGRNLVAPPPAWKPDLEIFIHPRELVLDFTDAGPDVRVVLRSDLR
jgi:hypothetical protein